MDLLLKGKLALVTGSTAGIGFAIAEGLARENATVIVNGRSEDRAAKAVENIRQKIPQAKVEAFVGDLSTVGVFEALNPGIPTSIFWLIIWGFLILSHSRKSVTMNGEGFLRLTS